MACFESREVARWRLDVSVAGSDRGEESDEGVNKVKLDINTLNLQNNVDATEISSFVAGADKKLTDMKILADRIKHRKDEAEKLKQHLKNYETIRKSLNVVLPNGSMTYHYKIDAINGVSLVVEQPEQQPVVLNPTDSEQLPHSAPTALIPALNAENSPLETAAHPAVHGILDLEPLSPITAPVLEPEHLSSSPDTAVSAPQTPDVPEARHSGSLSHTLVVMARPDEETRVTGDADAGLVKQRRGSGGDCGTAQADHVLFFHDREPYKGPLFFEYGVQYRPTCTPTTNSDDNDNDSTHESVQNHVRDQNRDQSRMVVFSGLAQGTRALDILAKVRGGTVLRIARADPTTMLVYFVQGRDARNYVEHIKSRSTQTDQAFEICGVTPCIFLPDTPSYPLRPQLLHDITYLGVTRTLAFALVDGPFQVTLKALLTQRGLWLFVEAVLAWKSSCMLEAALIFDPGDYAQILDSHSEWNSYPELADLSDPYRHTAIVSSEPALQEEWAAAAAVDDYIYDDKQQQREQGEYETITKSETESETNDHSELSSVKVLHISFRDIVHAQRAYRFLIEELWGCGVSYAPDRCAGPLSELGTSQYNADWVPVSDQW
ncbi:hypothetical protein F4777DRAFT_572524 [Nemania sp. FL0916]|nr:hypothetical protein F4777DRAFT_572524 [Nemania sp. FL0916]